MTSSVTKLIPGELFPDKPILYEETTPKGLRSIYKIISAADFMQMSKGTGGRIGVIPWYMANVISSNGERVPSPIVRLSVSNYLYLSDFGGGFKKIMTPYDGLAKELEEEVPLWKDYLMEQIQQKSNLFITLEQFYLDPKKFHPLPLMILVFLRVSPETLNELGFKPTPEIRAVFDQTLQQFNQRVDASPLTGNLGIRMYHRLRKTGAADKYLDIYFRSKRVSDIEIDEKDLTNDKVQVALFSNNGETLPFSQLIRNNSEFSKSEVIAWKKRAIYAKTKLTPRRPRPALPAPPVSQGSRVSYGSLLAAKQNRMANQNQKEEKKNNNNGFTIVQRSHKEKRNSQNRNRGNRKNRKNVTRRR